MPSAAVVLTVQLPSLLLISGPDSPCSSNSHHFPALLPPPSMSPVFLSLAKSKPQKKEWLPLLSQVYECICICTSAPSLQTSSYQKPMPSSSCWIALPCLLLDPPIIGLQMSLPSQRRENASPSIQILFQPYPTCLLPTHLHLNCCAGLTPLCSSNSPRVQVPVQACLPLRLLPSYTTDD